MDNKTAREHFLIKKELAKTRKKFCEDRNMEIALSRTQEDLEQVEAAIRVFDANYELKKFVQEFKEPHAMWSQYTVPVAESTEKACEDVADQVAQQCRAYVLEELTKILRKAKEE